MNASTRTLVLQGPAGAIDVAVDYPSGPIQGVGLVAHPHPLWARPQNLPVVVLPGADHFFHRRLTQLKRLVVSHLIAWPLLAGVAGQDSAEAASD